MGKVLIFFVLLVLFVPAVCRASLQEDEILGRWISEKKDAIIDVSRCGENFCGDVVWSRRGASATDHRNPDPDLRSRPIIGLRIASDLRYKGQSKWKGTVYDPQSGRSFKAEIRTMSPDRLSLRGYIATPILGKTMLWSRTAQSAGDITKLN